MTVEISWQTPVPLGSKSTFMKRIEDFDLGDCPDAPGIYIFARRFGKKILVPIYIGKGTSLRKRLKTQFNNHKLIQALANEKSGERVLMFGTIKAGTSGSIAKKIRLSERAHIEHALSAGHPLINIQLTKKPTSEIKVVGKKSHNHPFPRVMLAR